MYTFLKFAPMLGVCLLLNGCMAAVVGAQAGAELLTDRIVPEYKRKGAALLKMATWNETEVKTTYSISGKEEWKCAQIKQGQWDNTGSYEYLCLASNEKLLANKNYQCKEGKGGFYTMVVNKQSMQTVYCKLKK